MTKLALNSDQELAALIESASGVLVAAQDVLRRAKKLARRRLPEVKEEISDDATIEWLFSEFKVRRPEFDRSASVRGQMTRLMNAMENINIKTVGDLRRAMQERGRPKRSGRFQRSWYLYNCAQKTRVILVDILEEFDL